MSRMHATSQFKQAGFSLVDAAVALAIVSVAIGACLPNFGAMRDRRQLEGAASQLETEMQLARSAAVAMNQSVRLTFSEASGASCYVVHTGAANACSCNVDGTASCSSGAQALRNARLVGALSVSSNAASLVFDGDHGTVTPTATIELRNRRDEAIRLVVNIMGRIRACSLGQAHSGMPRC